MYAQIANDTVMAVQNAQDATHTDYVGPDVCVGATRAPYGWANPPQPPPAYVPPPPPPPLPRLVSKLAFRNRFTLAEKAMLEIACLDNPAAVMSARQQAAVLRATMKDQESAEYIDLNRADTRAGVQSLETAGIVATGRTVVIMDTAVTELERYKG
jgi:hypothetical protein